MERESQLPTRKLVEVAARDFPNASTVQVSFPDKWEHLATIESANSSMYIAGFPIERAYSTSHHFAGLPHEINVNLVFYRFYKFFEPWPRPQLTLEWQVGQPHGQVTEFQGFQVQLQPIGQVQAWFGVENAVLWECYMDSSRRDMNSQQNWKEVWERVEQDVDAVNFFTLPHEPAFEGSYIDFLKQLGYQEDPEHFCWWRKSRERSRISITASSA